MCLCAILVTKGVLIFMNKVLPQEYLKNKKTNAYCMKFVIIRRVCRKLN